MAVSDYLTLDLRVLNQQTKPDAPQKGIPTVLAKKERKLSREAQAKAFRAACWERDQSRCRATKKPVAKNGVDYDKVGEVHHTLKRSTHPEDIYTVSLAILLTKTQPCWRKRCARTIRRTTCLRSTARSTRARSKCSPGGTFTVRSRK